MNNLIKFISKYHLGFLFFFLQLIAIILIVQNNRYHNAGFINASNFFTGGIYSSFKEVSVYINLKSENEKLSIENARLLNKLKSVTYSLVPPLKEDSLSQYSNTDTLIIDTINQFEYIPAIAISNSINKRYNYIYLNKGTNDSIHNDMGIVESNGVVGVVVNSTYNYSVVMPLINEKSNISVKINNQGYFGTLQWEKGAVQYAQIKEIPNHVRVEKGDTIVTSGYSQIFPQGMLIGFVESSNKEKGQSYLNIKIKLSVDFSKVNFTYALKNNELADFKKIIIE